jgi:DNA-binding transcriptional ArsR family regulator
MVPEPIGAAPSAPDPLSLAFGALADPTRRAILSRLVTGEASVAELAQPFRISPRAVSKHIGVLERAGLVERGRDAQRRPSRIRVAPLRDAYNWLDAYRTLWEQRFDRVGALLDRIQNEDPDATKR